MTGTCCRTDPSLNPRKSLTRNAELWQKEKEHKKGTPGASIAWWSDWGGNNSDCPIRLRKNALRVLPFIKKGRIFIFLLLKYFHSAAFCLFRGVKFSSVSEERRGTIGPELARPFHKFIGGGVNSNSVCGESKRR